MADDFRIVLEGDAAVQVAFESRIDPVINARVIRTAEALRADGRPGVRDVVGAYATVTIHFDPLRTDIPALVEAAASRARESAWPEGDARRPRRIVVPVCYGGEFGPDLGEVAALAGCGQEEVVRRHAGRSYRVYMLGFLPGFAYLGIVDEAIAVPRRATPRLRVPAGSVGIAGGQTGVYASEAPGGWQLVGRTPLRPYDPDRPDPFLFAAGDDVTLEPVTADAFERLAARPARSVQGGTPASRGGAALHVVRPGMLTTIQDAGRWGLQHAGVPVAGPMDPCAARLANRILRNPDDAAALEITLSGPEIECEGDVVVAVCGAAFELTIDDVQVPGNLPIPVRHGSRIRFGARRQGVRAYLAVAGGIDVPAVFGSRSTHLVSRLGPFGGRPLIGGDRLPVGEARARPRSYRATPATLPIELPTGGARVRILPGPRRSWLGDGAAAELESARYTITPESDRMGYRLSGPALGWTRDRSMLSEATPMGTLQVPPSGLPILLMADRQTTGGYPKIGTVITADLPLVGQLAPGDWVQFALCDVKAATAALIEQERALQRAEDD
jgi:KipI family sensor histidine kinase inhibitor